MTHAEMQGTQAEFVPRRRIGTVVEQLRYDIGIASCRSIMQRCPPRPITTTCRQNAPTVASKSRLKVKPQKSTMKRLKARLLGLRRDDKLHLRSKVRLDQTPVDYYIRLISSAYTQMRTGETRPCLRQCEFDLAIAWRTSPYLPMGVNIPPL